MDKCLFCTDIPSTTPPTCGADRRKRKNEEWESAFPFFCSKLGVSAAEAALSGRELGTTTPLCDTCKSAYDDVSMLFAHIEYLFLMADRRVAELKEKVKASVVLKRRMRDEKLEIFRSQIAQAEASSGGGPDYHPLNWACNPDPLEYSQSPQIKSEVIELDDPLGMMNDDEEELAFEIFPGDDEGGGSGSEDVETSTKKSKRSRKADADYTPPTAIKRKRYYGGKAGLLPMPTISDEVPTEMEGLKVFPSHNIRAGPSPVATGTPDGPNWKPGPEGPWRPLVTYQGFLYHYHKSSKSRHNFRCLRSTKCGGRISFSPDLKKVLDDRSQRSEEGQHNHPPSESLCEARYALWKFRKALIETNKPAEELIQQMYDSVTPEAKEHLPEKVVMENVKKRRKSGDGGGGGSEASSEPPISHHNS